jgi:hypothetical protein
MQTIVLDEAMRQRFQNLTDLLEVRDETGKVLGHFLPADRPAELLQALRSCPYTNEELERFGQEPGGRTLAEIWQRLGRQ